MRCFGATASSCCRSTACHIELMIVTLPETNSSPLTIGHSKRNALSSNHPGIQVLLLLVSGRANQVYHSLKTCWSFGIAPSNWLGFFTMTLWLYFFPPAHGSRTIPSISPRPRAGVVQLWSDWDLHSCSALVPQERLANVESWRKKLTNHLSWAIPKNSDL